MATKNVKSSPFEPMTQLMTMDKLPSNTLKRHPKMELNKNDLLRLLSYLEGELQARDITIAALKAEKAKQLLYQAKYGRFGLGDPFNSMQRDSDCQKDNSFDEAAVKAMYDNQLTQLENLIATQRKAQHRMREQLASVEKRYHKVCAELDDEKRKHAQDTAQGDDVTYMLEKDRERLKQEVDFEKSQVKKLEKDVKKAQGAVEEERSAAVRHKQVAIMLIKERKRLIDKMLEMQQKHMLLEQELQNERTRTIGSAGGAQLEAALEKQLSEFDVEREQLKARLTREESRCAEYEGNIEALHLEIEMLQKQLGSEKRAEGPQSIEIKSTTRGQLPPSKVPQPTSKYKSTPPNTPPEVRRSSSAQETPEKDTTSNQANMPTPPPQLKTGAVDSSVKRAIMQFSNSKAGKGSEKPVPAEKPADLAATSRINVIGPGGAVLGAPSSGGTTVFTTPSGTRISLNVGPSSKKASPAGRGTPPPIPPNKPTYVPPSTPGKALVRQAATQGPQAKPQPPTKFGITISKDKITISSPEGSNDNTRPLNSAGQRPLLSTGQDSGPRKPSQLSDNASSDINDSHPTTGSNMDLFGPEMEDLQQLLVSMVTGTCEGDSPSIDSLLNPSPAPPTIAPATASPPGPVTTPVSTSLLHHHTTQGDINTVYKLLLEGHIDVNCTLKDGTSALHCAAESGNNDCVKLLLEHGASANARRDDHFTPLHAAAGEGHYRCVELLLEHGADVQSCDQHGWTPLYWAATNGHTHCVTQLRDYGATINTLTTANWTPIHGAVHSGHADCLRVLLSYAGVRASEQTKLEHDAVVRQVIQMADQDAWTIAHLTAIRDTKDCLEVLLQHCQVDLQCKDKWGRTVLEVASKACRQFLETIDKHDSCTVTIVIEVTNGNNSKSAADTAFNVGTLKVTSDLTWSALEHLINGSVMLHLSHVSLGLRTKKTARHDAESPDSPTPYTLGLSTDSIHSISVGDHRWSPGNCKWQSSPFDLLYNNEGKIITVTLHSWENSCLDSLSYETLVSVLMLQNYLRLVEQYKSVVFYGPAGMGKTFLARRLAHYIQVKEEAKGNIAPVYSISFHNQFTKFHLIKLLREKGCLIGGGLSEPKGQTPIVILEDLHNISVAEVFDSLLGAIDHRGPKNSVLIHLEGGEVGSFYLTDNCYIVGTMDRCRSTGLELSVQQRFRWVHLRPDVEPARNLLHRHLLRKLVHRYGGMLPSSDDPVYRAVEWVICVWQRLNDGLSKLGLPDLVFGPGHFLSCPIEANKPKAIHKWLSMLWNHTIAPYVSEAVIRGSGNDSTTAAGQRKVAMTALYVLMQRAVVSGCPLSGQEKERYLLSFHGSNELDIKMRHDHREIRPTTSSPDSARDGNDSSAVWLTPSGSDVANPSVIVDNVDRRAVSPGGYNINDQTVLLTPGGQMHQRPNSLSLERSLESNVTPHNLHGSFIAVVGTKTDSRRAQSVGPDNSKSLLNPEIRTLRAKSEGAESSAQTNPGSAGIVNHTDSGATQWPDYYKDFGPVHVVNATRGLQTFSTVEGNLKHKEHM